MITVLVVDDSALDRHLAATLIREHPGWQVEVAEHGREALQYIGKTPPTLVLTDLQMPEINGLELVVAIRRDYPALPVILMTAHGSEEIAVEALQKGAASYVPKRNLARDLIPTIEGVLNLAKSRDHNRVVQDWLTTSEFDFSLGNDAEALHPLIGHLQQHMKQRKLIEESDLIRVGTALYEVLLNAIEHGNLGLSSELREIDDGLPYRTLAEQRRRLSPYKDRSVRLHARFSREEATFTIRDDGDGYDAKHTPDPTDPANMERCSGRGLLLIRTFMDDVRVNEKGNEIMLVKRRP